MNSRTPQRFGFLASALVLAAQCVTPSFAQSSGLVAGSPPQEGRAAADPSAPHTAHWFPRGMPLSPELMTLEGILQIRQKMRMEQMKRFERVRGLSDPTGSRPLGAANGVDPLAATGLRQPSGVANGGNALNLSPGMNPMDSPSGTAPFGPAGSGELGPSLEGASDPSGQSRSNPGVRRTR
jgi:hypothetical protein